MSNYSQKLKDPRWQKKRLEILARDEWKCQECGDTEETLTVHHLVYGKGEPWDIPPHCLITLCETCHKQEQEAVSAAVKRLIFEIKFCGFDAAMIDHISDGFSDLSLMVSQGFAERVDPDDAMLIADLIRDYHEAYRMYIPEVDR